MKQVCATTLFLALVLAEPSGELTKPSAHPPAPDLVESLNRALIPFDLNGPDFPASAVATVARGYSLIGIGESNHGAKEFMAARVAITERLIEDDGARTVAFEADYRQFAVLNRYVRGENVDPLSAMTSGLMYNSEEFRSFVEWVKRFNKAARSPVSFVGIDAVYAPGYIGAAKKLVEKADPGFEKRNGFAWLGFVDVKVPVQERIAKVDDLLQRLHGDTAIRKALGREDFDEVVESLGLFKALTTPKPSQDPDLSRDQFMADNLVAFLKNHKGQAVLWAHNSHVNKDNFHHIGKSLGVHLRERFGRRYYAIRTDFDHGVFWTLGQDIQSHEVGPAATGASGQILGLAKAKSFFLDFSTAAKEPEIKRFLSESQKSRYSGAVYDSTHEYTEDIPSQSFDALLFFDAITPFTLIKKSLASH